MADEYGERGIIGFASEKMISTMRQLEGVQSPQIGKIDVKEKAVVTFLIWVAMTLDGNSYYSFSLLTKFPFKYRVTKEQLMANERFTLSTFDSTLIVALKEAR
ncbi:hypothetical protein [Solobacterium moorei]|uniref:hypothetical protein n=1 Tax=Solobacterium moorei TaxID=102148 RepID=UPI0028E5CBE7|nr:hypothetical protein [Solobacterium moorei]